MPAMFRRLIPISATIAIAAGCGPATSTGDAPPVDSTVNDRASTHRFGPVTFAAPPGFEVVESNDREMYLEDRRRMLSIHCSWHRIPADLPGELKELRSFAKGYATSNTAFRRLHALTIEADRTSKSRFVFSDMELDDGPQRTRSWTWYLPAGEKTAVFLQATAATAVTSWDEARPVFAAVRESVTLR